MLLAHYLLVRKRGLVLQSIPSNRSRHEATSNIISSTGRMLKEQGAAIQKQATESTISPEVLKQAFQDALAAIEDVSTFKQEALPKMAETVAQFKELAETGEKEIARLERAKE